MQHWLHGPKPRLHCQPFPNCACSKGASARKLQSVRGKDAYKANDLLADQLVTVDQRLDYEAIVQIAEIDDQDVLYLNFDNVALGGCHTHPLLEVVALKGLQSVAARLPSLYSYEATAASCKVC